jgi:hypothetical protein
MEGSLAGQHLLLQAGNLLEEARIEDLQSQESLEWIISQFEPAGKSGPEHSINQLSGPCCMQGPRLDPVLLDRPPPHPGLLLK